MDLEKFMVGPLCALPGVSIVTKEPLPLHEGLDIQIEAFYGRRSVEALTQISSLTSGKKS
jgi:hypothetical protein